MLREDDKTSGHGDIDVSRADLYSSDETTISCRKSTLPHNASSSHVAQPASASHSRWAEL